MKKLVSIAFCLILTLSVLAGCSQKSAESTPDEVTTATSTQSTQATTNATEATAEPTTAATEAPTKAPTEPAKTKPESTPKPTKAPAVSNAPAYVSEYLRIINEYENTYGRATAYDSMSMGNLGFYYARLIDFDYNGTPELVLGYMGPGTGTAYSIYAMSGSRAVCVDTGSLFNQGGVDPSVKYAYTSNEIYFHTGTSQYAFETYYRRFNGYSFETVFSCTGCHPDGIYNVNNEPVTEEEYRAALDAYRAAFTHEESFRFNSNPSATVATIDNTKSTLRSYY